MLTLLRTWLITIVAASVFLSILLSVLPEGTIRTTAKTTGGLVLLLVMLQPVVNMDLTALTLKNTAGNSAVNAQIEAFAARANTQLRQGIEEKAAEVIKAKAKALGIVCSATVYAAERDGTYFPESVTLDIPKSEALAAYLAGELAIDEAHQQWKGVG